MRMLRIANVLMLAMSTLFLWHGFEVRWELSVLPLLLAISGALVGLVGHYVMSIIECVLMGIASLVLALGGSLSFGAAWLMLLGSSHEQINRASQDGEILLFAAFVAFVCTIWAGITAARGVRRAIKAEMRQGTI